MEKKKIGVVIPCINLWDKYTKPAIDSLKSSNELFVVVVDNGSTDNTTREASRLASEGALGCYIKNPKNEGVSVAWNQGAKKCWEANCDYVLIINNDVLFHPNAVDNLVNRFEIGRLLAKQVSDESVKGSVFDGIQDNLAMVTCINVRGDCKDIPANIFTLDDAAYQQAVESEHPDFSAFMINKATYDKVGQFDEGFNPGYYEDNDYHRRIDLSGLKAINCPPALFYHYGSATRYQPGLDVVTHWQFQKSQQYYILKWGGMPAPQNSEVHKQPFGDSNHPINWVWQDRHKTSCTCKPKCELIMKMIGA